MGNGWRYLYILRKIKCKFKIIYQLINANIINYNRQLTKMSITKHYVV